jgi:proteic killer suppression protein
MIRSFRSKPLSDLFATGKSAKVQPKHLKRLKLILTMLNVATHAGQMSAPGLRLHMLEPKKAGRYSVWVDENYRVTFAFDGTDAVGVDYEDYH